jgi:hypothetical protein
VLGTKALGIALEEWRVKWHAKLLHQLLLLFLCRDRNDQSTDLE